MKDSSKNKVVITGGSGFLGSYMSEILLGRGFEVVVLDINSPSNEEVLFAKIDMLGDGLEHELLENPYAVINLAGKNIFGRWNEEFKRLVYNTRVEGTKNLISLFEEEKYRPEVLISASASGFYGDRGDEVLDGESEAGEGFLADLCEDWEKAAREAERFGVSTVVIRNGNVLGEGGLLSTILPFYRWGLGGPLGSGEQWFPWIHIEDISNIYIKAIENSSDVKTINAVAPNQVRNKTFSRVLAEVLSKPHLFSVPQFALKIIFGELGEEILNSQKIETKVEGNLNYEFRHPKLKEALKDILISE